MDLLDIINERDKAIDLVEANASHNWKNVAYVTALAIAVRQRTLVSEDVWEHMPEGTYTHEPRAMGAIMRQLRKDNIIVPTGEYTISKSPLGHGRPSHIWKSNIYEEN